MEVWEQNRDVGGRFAKGKEEPLRMELIGEVRWFSNDGFQGYVFVRIPKSKHPKKCECSLCCDAILKRAGPFGNEDAPQPLT